MEGAPTHCPPGAHNPEGWLLHTQTAMRLVIRARMAGDGEVGVGSAHTGGHRKEVTLVGGC